MTKDATELADLGTKDATELADLGTMSTHGAETTTDEDISVDEDTEGSKWRLFEEMIAAAERELDKNADVEHNQYVSGQESKTNRQIDVLARGRVVRAGIDVVIECKRYTRKLGIGKVDEFIGKLQDVGAHHGVLYAYSGVTKPARARADGARRPSVEIRDFNETQAELDRLAAVAPSASGSAITYEHLLKDVAAQFGEVLARDVGRHLSYNCAAGTGCQGVVDVVEEEGSVAFGTCDHCYSLHLLCECDESLVYVHGSWEERCWCGAEYLVRSAPDAEVNGIDHMRHGVGCDGRHAPEVARSGEPDPSEE